MASPHVAGFGALILAKNPQWSPATVKSAMMTTAGPVKLANGAVNKDVFATGAGQVDPAKVLSPGLVYDATTEDYLKFVQGTGLDLGIEGLGTTQPRDMNVPSFALGNLAGKIEVTRTVTALTPGLYRASVNVPGVNVKVTPSVLNFAAAGEKKTFKVQFENNNAALGEFARGSLSWQGANKTVTSPIAVRPQSVIADKAMAFTGTGPNGSAAINIVSGTNAPVGVTVDGLSKADSSAIELVPGPFAGETNASNFVKKVTVGENSALAKFSVISSDEAADFDMLVLTPTGQQLPSATGSASESVTVPDPEPGDYYVFANLYASPNNQPTKATVDAAVLGANEGNATVTPNPIRLANGKAGTISLNWTNLTQGSYIGRLTFEGTSEPSFVTVVVSPGGAAVVPDDENPKKEKKNNKIRGDEPTQSNNAS